MADKYQAISLRYGLLARARDRRNARRDRRKDIVNYRRNKTTRYLKLIKSEAELKLNSELGHYSTATAEQQELVEGAGCAVVTKKRVLEDLESKRSQLTEQLDKLGDNFVKRAEVERRLNDVTNEITEAEASLAHLQDELRNAKSTLDTINKIYRNNCNSIKTWAEARTRLYIDTLFKNNIDISFKSSDKKKEGK